MDLVINTIFFVGLMVCGYRLWLLAAEVRRLKVEMDALLGTRVPSEDIGITMRFGKQIHQ